jgi:Fe-S cluster assembly iron-binding protein IscA
MNFTLTPAATKFIRMMIRADGDASSGFRLAVSPGGCSGLAADISVRREPAAGEAVVERDGVKLFLPAESRILLDGVTHRLRRHPVANRTRLQGSEAGFLLEPLDRRRR